MTEHRATGVAGVTLREAREADADLIFALIRELAEYERLADEVVTDAARLREALFGPRAPAEVIIAECDGSPAGFALFFTSFSTFVGRPGLYLEDLFVRPRYRRRGIGALLLAYLARLATQRGCGRLEWAVLDWNQPAIDFYRRLGARAMDEWTVYRVAGPALTALAARFDRPMGAEQTP